MQYIVEAEDLKKRFGDFFAVNGVSFVVERGECFGILGPNGAGKTTTIRMIYGLSPLTGGELRVFGMRVPDRLREVKYRIGVCQQEDNLDPELSVKENLRVFARYFDISAGVATRRAEELLDFMELTGKAKARVSEISGGMKRRLLLARSLVNEPELLILDEPTSGLDPQARHRIWERIEDLKNGGMTVLLTTHNMDEAAHLCDRLIIMDEGKIILQGNPGVLVEEKQDGEELFYTISSQFKSSGTTLRMANLEDLFLKLTGRELRE
jgi:lipooligosaccharide transport system ATP-binding protein